MIKFRNVNVNPKHRKTGDCSTRALVGTLDIPYEEALRLQCEEAIKHCYGITCKQTIERVLKKFGYVKMKQPRKADNTKYLVSELDQILTPVQMYEGVLVTVSNHHTCIKGGYIQDIWDCGGYTVGNYYVRGDQYEGKVLNGI